MFHRDEESFNRFCSEIAYELDHTQYDSCEVEIKGKKYTVFQDFQKWNIDGVKSVRRQIARLLNLQTEYADFESVKKSVRGRAGFEFDFENLLAKQLREGTENITREQMFDANFRFA